MAVTTNTVSVGTGDNWTNSQLLDAMESAFQACGLHGGTARYGVPTACLAPGLSSTSDNPSDSSTTGGVGSEAWKTAAPALSYRTNHARNYDVTQKTGNTAWIIKEYWQPTGASNANDTLTVPANSALTTGKEVVWCPGQSDQSYNISLLTLGQTYWVIRVDATTIKLATSSTNALNGTAQNIGGDAPTGGWTVNTRLYEPAGATSENKKISVIMGDTINLHFPNNDGRSFKTYQQDLPGGDTLDSDKEWTYDNRSNLHSPGIAWGSDWSYFPNEQNTSGTEWYVGNPSSTGDIKRWRVSTNNGLNQTDKVKTTDSNGVTLSFSVDKPAHMNQGGIIEAAWGTNTYDLEQRNYNIDRGWYTSSPKVYSYIHPTHSAMKGEIEILPGYNNGYNYINPFWDVEIPNTNGGGSDAGATNLFLRVRRWHGYNNSTHGGRIKDVQVINVASTATNPYNSGTGLGGGWKSSTNHSFTILGSKIGGVDGTDDLVFGENTAETSTGASDGKPSLICTDFGGANDGKFFLKSKHGRFAVLRVVNDATKKYGTTFYSFSLADGPGDAYQNTMFINSGTYVEVMNCMGIHHNKNEGGFGDDDIFEYGYFCGVMGEERQYAPYCAVHNGYVNMDDYLETSNQISYGSFYRFCKPTNSNDAALKIHWYKGNNAQDPNFSILSFVQTVNTEAITWFTFSIPKGPQFMNPNPGIDYDELYNGSITRFGHDRETNYYSSEVKNGWDDSVFVTATRIPGWTADSKSTVSDPPTLYTKCRDAMWGYLRTYRGLTNSGWTSAGGKAEVVSRWQPSIATYKRGNDYDWNSHGTFYYRNSDIDKISSATSSANQTTGVSATSDYYRPVKGIPLQSNLVPCPYYLPDDFVLIHIGASPGDTEYRQGDTITVISGVEVYQIIYACYNQAEYDYDEAASNLVNGVLLCARIT
jgi:hypothetical protein